MATEIVKPTETPSYGQKSAAPSKAVKAMSSKQEEPSSKHELHGAKAKPKTK
jgi:hypothetical protein